MRRMMKYYQNGFDNSKLKIYFMDRFWKGGDGKNLMY